jgi:hypothetical protein
MTVMVVNGNRYLLNTDMCEKAQDETAQRILSDYPHDAIIEFDTPKIEDLI